MEEVKAINDGQVIRGHITTCDGCGCEGVYCDTDCGYVDQSGREVYVDFEGKYECLKAGKEDGSITDELFCEDCATIEDD